MNFSRERRRIRDWQSTAPKCVSRWRTLDFLETLSRPKRFDHGAFLEDHCPLSVIALLMMSANRVLFVARKCQRKLFSTAPTTTILGILEQVQRGTLDPQMAESLIAKAANPTPEDSLQAFANLDHTRSSRTGFPEAVFAEGKTPEQVARILDDFARNLNEEIQRGAVVDSRRAILATR